MKNTLSGENHFFPPPDWITLKKIQTAGLISMKVSKTNSVLD